MIDAFFSRENSQNADQDDTESSTFEDLSVSLTPYGGDLNGRLRSGKMELTGWVRHARIGNFTGAYYPLMGSDRKSVGWIDMDIEDPELREVECVLVLEDNSKDPEFEFVLTLEAIGRDENNIVEYRRVGIGKVSPGWCRLGSKQRITVL